MNFFKRIPILFSKTKFEQYISDFLTGNDVGSPYGGMTQEQALKYSAFFACNRVLAETFASVPIHEYKKIDNKGNREKTNDTGLYPILHFAPNNETSRYNFQECLMYQLNLGGNFVAERIMNGSKIAGLSQIEWQRYQIFRDKNDKKVKYRVSGSGEPIVLDRSQVLHVPGPSTNGIVGMSILEYATETIRLGSGYNDFTQKFFDNGVTATGYFKHPGFLKEEAYQRMKKETKDQWTGMKNLRKPMLLEDGLEFEALTIKPVDAEILSSKKFQIEDICRFFRVQPHLIQHLEKSTFNNIEQQSLEFVMYTMLPHFKRVEENINSQLLTPKQVSQGYYYEYNIASLLRGDQKAMAESFAKGIQWGWFSVNDVRRLLNLNSVNGGDTYLQPMNMVPLGTDPTVPENNTVDQAIENKVKYLLEQSAKEGNL